MKKCSLGQVWSTHANGCAHMSATGTGADCVHSHSRKCSDTIPSEHFFMQEPTRLHSVVVFVIATVRALQSIARQKAEDTGTRTAHHLLLSNKLLDHIRTSPTSFHESYWFKNVRTYLSATLGACVPFLCVRYCM